MPNGVPGVSRGAASAESVLPPGRVSVAKFAFILIQLALLTLIIRQFQIESAAFVRLAVLSVRGIHRARLAAATLAPALLRHPFSRGHRPRAGPARGRVAGPAGSGPHSALPSSPSLLGPGGGDRGGRARSRPAAGGRGVRALVARDLADPGVDVHVPPHRLPLRPAARQPRPSRCRARSPTSSCCRTSASRCSRSSTTRRSAAPTTTRDAARDLSDRRRTGWCAGSCTCCSIGSSTTTSTLTPAEVTTRRPRPVRRGDLPALPAGLGAVPPDRRHAAPVRLPPARDAPPATTSPRASRTSGGASTSTGKTS